MKWLITILALILSCAAAVAGNADIWRRKPAAGFVVGFDFSGQRVTSPTGHTGTLAGNASVATGALVLDGNGDWMYLADSPELDMAGNMTCSAWVRRNGNPATFEIVAAKYALSAGWLMSLDSGGKINFDGRTAAGSFAIGPESAASICNNAWRHVAAVRSGSDWILYLDGALVGSVANGGHTFANAQPLAFGAYNTEGGWGYPLTGSIGGPRLYNRALSAAEIAQIYHTGAARVAAGGTP